MLDIEKMDMENVIYSWRVQKSTTPIIMKRAKGVYMWDIKDNRYLDFCSGLLCVNIGHGNKHVLAAMKKQMEECCYVGTMYGTYPKAKLANMISELTPGDLNHVFFTLGGAEANENAIKAARAVTGRHKIYSRWRSYHGATAGAITLTGDPRRWAAEPGIPGVVKFFGPYQYHCPFGSENDEECGEKTLNVLKTQIMLDGPKTIAAIIIEPIVGTNGIIIPPKNYIKGLRQICDENGILLIADEVMSGWGRTGKWFGIDNFDVVPDIMTMAKGLTSGYVPLGAMVWNDKVWNYFQEKPFVGGLTYGGHALACATGIANIEVYKKEGLIENSKNNGDYLGKLLGDLKQKHPSVGDVRYKGLWACIELTSDKKTKAPIAGFNDSVKNVSKKITKILIDKGVHCFSKWDYIFIAPPLCVTKEQIDEGIDAIDKALDYTDSEI